MSRKFSLKNKRIIAPILAVSVLAGSILGAAIMDPIQAYAAKVTLKGINDIADAHSISDAEPNPRPFVILEVVPDKAKDAALGYLVGGEEPVNNGRSLKDMPSAAERNKYIKVDTTDPDNPVKVYDPTVISPDSLAPNFGSDKAAAYELNGKAFSFAPYAEPHVSTETEQNMEIRGHFVKDEKGDYVYNDFNGDDGYRKEYANSSGADPDDASRTLKDVATLYDKTVTDTEQIYRRSASFRRDDYYTGNYYFDIKKITDEAAQMPVLVGKDATFDPKSSNNLYNSQYFTIEKVTDTDQITDRFDNGESVILYRTVKDGSASNPEYYGYVKKNDSGDIVVHPKNFGEVIKDDNGDPILEDDGITPKTFKEIKVSEFTTTTLAPIYFRSSRRMMSAAPSMTGVEATPTPTATPDDAAFGGEPTPTPSPTATPDDGTDGSVSPTATPDDGTDGSVSPTATPDDATDGGEPTPTPTVTPDGGTDNSGNPSTVPDGSGDPGPDGNDQGTTGNDPATDGNTPDPNDNAGIGSNGPLNKRATDYRGISGRRNTDTAVLGALRSDIEYDYYILIETTAGDTENTLYCIDADTVTENENGGFGRKTGYGMVVATTYSSTNASRDKGPYYIKLTDADEYSYDPKTDPADARERYRFVTDYSEEIYHLTDHSGGFVNYEWFKRYVLDREEGKPCEKLYVDVVTVTPGELAKDPELIDKAHLIYFAGGRYKEDISAQNAVKIINKVLNEDFPIMLERSMYYSNLYNPNVGMDITDENERNEFRSEKVNITLLALELMQERFPEGEEWTIENWVKIAGNKDTPATQDTFYTRSDAEVIVTEGSGRKGYYSGDPIDNSKVSSVRSDLLYSMRYSYKADMDVSFVHGTIFVNDDWYDEKKDYSKYGTEIREAKIVRSDFNTQYSEEKINGISGFQEIIEEYENERPIIETYGSWEDFNSSISKATCIRYILNANNNRFAVKAKLRILDIEPLETAQYSSQDSLLSNLTYNGSNGYSTDSWETDVYDRERDYLTADWVKDNLEFEEDEDAITIKQMGTREFIGINTDLNETYDMIYIGMDTGLMNTSFGSARIKTRKTMYNNTMLNELVYSHMGDSLEHGYYNAHVAQRHGSGNDITLNKKNELINYLKAGYTILLSDDFFILDEDREIVTNPDGIVTTDSINTAKLDSSSQLYDFIANTVLARNDEGYVYFRKNVYRRGELEKVTPGYAEARRRFARYLNISKLELVVNKEPVEYNERINESETEHHYLTPNGDGSYSLDFEIELKNDVALDASNTSYNCKLYIDYDSDGKFESDEELGGISINGQTVEGDGKFYLKAGETYSISRMVPEDYIGFLPWKLAFIQNESESDQPDNAFTSVRCAVTGFCAVPADPENRPSINVLQILPNGTNTLDLKDDHELQQLYSQVQDFEVVVSKISADDFVRKKDTAKNAHLLSYYDYLCQYDMIVLGFSDAYNFTPYEGGFDIPVARTDSNGNVVITRRTDITADQAMHDAVLAVREYCISGRSVLFTHDLTSANNNDSESTGFGYYMNQYLRDVQGLDRYGHSTTQDLTYIFDAENTIKNYEYVYDDKLKIKGNDIGDDMGYTDVEVFRNKRHPDNQGGNWGNTTRLVTYDYNVDTKAPNWSTDMETVTAINEGQITQYPFLITQGTSGDTPESQFEVAMTHSQYYQLDMDTNIKDDNLNDDIVVWYAISNKDDDPRDGTLHEYYKALHNDVRNNYYIFTKGNVTYTGSGHSPVTSLKEKQLFVNTLVAAYKSGVSSPKVIFKENPWEQSADIRGINIPYDVNMTLSETADDNAGGWLEDTVAINFKTLNNNFKGSQKGLNVRYFVEVAPGEGDVNLKGQSFKEITPVKFYLIEYDGKKNDGVSPYNLENYRIYQAVFATTDLDLGDGLGVLPEDQARIYIQIGTDELSSGDIEELQPYESLPTNMLGIYTTRLFDLQ